MANIFRPVDDGRYPVVVSRLPYGKDTPIQYLVVDPVALAENGYIVAIQDVRGRFASEGTYGGFEQEFDDGYDTIEWAAGLPGSNGRVGMFGASYFAFTQMAAAASGHPVLKTVAPAVVFDDPLDGMAYRQGALEWGLSAFWYATAMVPAAVMRDLRTDQTFPMRLARMVEDADHLADVGYWTLPLTEFSPPRRVGLFDYVEQDMAHPLEMQRRFSVRPKYPNLSVSGSFTGGWYDIFLKQTIDIYQAFRVANRSARLTIGPWTHGNMGSEVGDLNFGMSAHSALLDLRETPTARHVRWFDSELKQIENGLMDEPPIKFFTMGENRWQTAAKWPLPNTRYTPWYFHSGGRAQTLHGDGRLSMTLPDNETSDQYVYDPANPVPTLGGNLLMPAQYRSGPVDQTPTEMRADVLVYTSDPLAKAMEVTGPVSAHLWVCTDARDTDFVVRLTDVHPDGGSFNVVDGIVRMRYRQGMAHAVWAEPGEIYPVEIDLWSTSHVFLPGHRIRVHVTSSSFPRWNRNLNTGASNEETAAMVTARQTIWHDRLHPSHVRLPIIPR